MKNRPATRGTAVQLIAIALWLGGHLFSAQAEVSVLIQQAAEAEARLDSQQALALYEQALIKEPKNAGLLQKIARQYSDLVVDQTTVGEKKAFAQQALDYAQRAVALEPNNPVNVLSLAVCYGKLAVYSDAGEKVRYSHLIKSAAEQSLGLDPHYAWAHHILGRWHYEVASLSGPARFFARLIYGGLPAADIQTGINHLNRATELEPDELNHFLELGFAFAAAGELSSARSAWQHGLAMPARSKHDPHAKLRAQRALEKAK